MTVNLHVAYTNENAESGVAMVSARGGAGVAGIVTLPDPKIRRIGRVLSKTALAWFRDNIGSPTQRLGP